jgi:23S rRNA pseudouridine1911/1915/1917 synthase
VSESRTEPEPRVIQSFDGWMVIDKPAGLHTVAQAGSQGPSVESWLRANHPECSELAEAGLCHRLDQWTSGCLVVATRPDQHERLRTVFGDAGSGVRKVYLALARKGLSAQGRFRLHFESRYKRSAKVTVSESGDAWSAGRCMWRVLGPGPAGHDRVEVELIGPGRRHQIRAGLAHLGHPLAGDSLYGGAALAGLHGPALHAWRIRLEEDLVEAPPPQSFGTGTG